MFKSIFVVVLVIACASAKPKAYAPLAYSAPLLATSAQISSRTYNGIHHPLAYAAPLTAAAYSAPLAAAPLAAPLAPYASPYSAYAAHPYAAHPYAAHPYAAHPYAAHPYAAAAAYSPYVI